MSGRLVCILLIAALGASGEVLDAEAARKLRQAIQFLDAAWSQMFSSDPPAVAGFTKSHDSACGPLPAGNAYFCEKDHTIYYDSEFLEALRRRIGRLTGSDGTAAPITALAHELGHAIYARMTGPSALPRPQYDRLNGYGQEKLADCFAGVVTRSAYDEGLLDDTNLREAEQTMVTIGEPQTFRERAFFRRKGNYPNWRVRREMFLAGFRQGPQACVTASIEKLASPGTR